MIQALALMKIARALKMTMMTTSFAKGEEAAKEKKGQLKNHNFHK